MIDSIREATKVAFDLIQRKTQDSVVRVIPTNHSRHRILATSKGLKYYVLFKREFFKSFGKIFGLSGAGDSINARYLCLALNLKVDGMLFIYQNGYVYFMSPREIYDMGLVRTTKSGERTYSFMLSAHKRWR